MILLLVLFFIFSIETNSENALIKGDLLAVTAFNTLESFIDQQRKNLWGL